MPAVVPLPLEDEVPPVVAVVIGPLEVWLVAVGAIGPLGPLGPPPMLMPAAVPLPAVTVMFPELVTPPLTFERLRLIPAAGPVGLLALIVPAFVTPFMLPVPVAPMPTPEAPELMVPRF